MDKLALMHDENLKLVFFVLVSDNVCVSLCLPKLTLKNHVWLPAQAELCMIICHPCLAGCTSAVVVTKF